MDRWGEARVLQAAPDASSIKAARKIVPPRFWSDTGATDELLWGRCTGSGSTPYQVVVDLAEPAYHCSCPSRKFPCKHALALLLHWSGDEFVEHATAPADFAAEWAQGRAERSARRRRRTEASSTPAPRDGQTRDGQARTAQAREARETRMDAGIADFALWLGDIARRGLADTRSQAATIFEAAAARLVDDQCPALAADVRDGERVLLGDDWTAAGLQLIGRWWTITQAWQRRAELTEDQFADLRVALGWSWSTEEIIARGTTPGRWLVLGSHRSHNGALTEARTWLQALDSGDLVYLQDFAPTTATLPPPRPAGEVLTGTIAHYPGSTPRRAILIDPTPTGTAADLPPGVDTATAAARIIAHRTANPLARRTPLVLAAATFTHDHVVDLQGTAIPLDTDNLWQLMALTGGHPVTSFGEWTAAGYRPLSISAEGKVSSCG